MKILVIDDSNFSRVSTIKLLKEFKPDAEIIEADGGQAGIELFETESPDLVITDLLMPEVSGEIVVKQIRPKNQTCFICVLSANVQETVQQEFIELGADLFLEKPISPKKIQMLMASYAQKKSLTEESVKMSFRN